MEDKSKIESLVTHVREYAEERIHLVELNVHDKVSRAVSGLASAFLLLILGIFVALFLSLGLAWWIGRELQEPFLGFLIVGGIYLIAGIILFLNREKWLRLPFINMFLKSVANEEN